MNIVHPTNCHLIGPRSSKPVLCCNFKTTRLKYHIKGVKKNWIRFIIQNWILARWNIQLVVMFTVIFIL
ncbi:unnamed protein product [Schistosoma curassoni]|uniref:Uncharacterized protein n=1 Tax=Schistosoma curassoni TaxID=6186 RepID=A0A183KPT9_9TREM|nr:unnamed protein product [Schistosoma curassoni]